MGTKKTKVIEKKAQKALLFFKNRKWDPCVTFNKGQCLGHKEASTDHMPQTSINSLTTEKIMDEHVQPDTFTPPSHTLLGDVRKSLYQLLVKFKWQFAQDVTNIGTTHLTKMQIDMAIQNLPCRSHTPSLLSTMIG